MTEIETPLSDTEAPETSSRPKTLTAIAILLGVIALLSTMTFAMSFRPIGLLRDAPADFSGGGSPPRRGPSLEGGFQAMPGGDGPTFQANSGGLQGGIRAAGPLGMLGSIGLAGPTFIIIRNVLGGLGIVLALLCAWFVWKQKRWALNLAIALGILFLLGALPGLFLSGGRGFQDGFAFAQTGLNALKALAALPVIGLSMLPSVRDFTS